jgi:DNA-directed RNA polymerase subunit RPC12/RpoP
MACGVDTGAVFKHPVHCFRCDEAFYFTLRKIAEAKTLACPQCGSDINLADRPYESLATRVKETIALIDAATGVRVPTHSRSWAEEAASGSGVG